MNTGELANTVEKCEIEGRVEIEKVSKMASTIERMVPLDRYEDADRRIRHIVDALAKGVTRWTVNHRYVQVDLSIKKESAELASLVGREEDMYERSLLVYLIVKKLCQEFARLIDSESGTYERSISETRARLESTLRAATQRAIEAEVDWSKRENALLSRIRQVESEKIEAEKARNMAIDCLEIEKLRESHRQSLSLAAGGDSAILAIVCVAESGGKMNRDELVGILALQIGDAHAMDSLLCIVESGMARRSDDPGYIALSEKGNAFYRGLQRMGWI